MMHSGSQKQIYGFSLMQVCVGLCTIFASTAPWRWHICEATGKCHLSHVWTLHTSPCLQPVVDEAVPKSWRVPQEQNCTLSRTPPKLFFHLFLRILVVSICGCGDAYKLIISLCFSCGGLRRNQKTIFRWACILNWNSGWIVYYSVLATVLGISQLSQFNVQFDST